jgi:DNA-directed RNA polymerase specialized sigma24 family protein
VWIVDVEGGTFAEAAEVLGVSEAGARKRASRARARLRAKAERAEGQ